MDGAQSPPTSAFCIETLQKNLRENTIDCAENLKSSMLRLPYSLPGIAQACELLDISVDLLPFSCRFPVFSGIAWVVFREGRAVTAGIKSPRKDSIPLPERLLLGK